MIFLVETVDFKVPAVNFAKCITNPIPTPHAIFRACGNERLFGAVAGSQTNTAAIFQQTFRSLGKRRNVTGAQTNKLNYMYKPFWGLYDTFPTCWHFWVDDFPFPDMDSFTFFFAGADLYEHPSLPRKGEV